MSGVNIEYKGESIATIPNTGSKTIKTQGKYCEGDILVEYEAPPAPQPTSKYIVDMKHDLHDRSSDIPNTYLGTNGAETPYNGWKATDYIQLPDYPIVVTCKTGSFTNLQYCYIYDEHKSNPRQLRIIDVDNTLQNIIESAITNYNAKYIRFSAQNSVIDSISVYPIYTETECDVPQIISDPTNLSYFNISINSLIDIINALSDRTGLSSNILTVGSLNLSKLTAEQKAIATNKNWTLA